MMDLDSTRDRVFARVKSDPIAADTRLSLFIAACESYRHDSILRPFPPFCVSEDGRKDINGLVSLLFIVILKYFLNQLVRGRR